MSLRRRLAAIGTSSAVVAISAVGALNLAPPASAAASVCTNPTLTFYGQDSSGLGNYYADGNIWNPVPGLKQVMGVCNKGSWYSTDYVPTNVDQTSVKAYPNVHKDFHNWSTGFEPRISSFTSINGTYAGFTNNVGIYNVAWDIWVNGVGGGANEIMIWTENRGQRPFGNKVASNVTVDGKAWDLWASGDNKYLAFVPTNGQAYKSGSLRLKAFLTNLMNRGRLSTRSTLGQVDYGIEVCSTGGKTLRFDVTNFSVTTS